MSRAVCLRSLSVVHFRNLAEQTVAFAPGVHLVAGANGVGKTNLFDAIHYLCLGRSHFPYGDPSAVAHDAKWLRLDARFEVGGRPERIVLKLQPRKGKTIERNGAAYASIVEHVGLLPAVMLSPGDVQLVTGGPEERRRFVDQTISQYSPPYLRDLLAYNRLLKLRNSLIKSVEHPLELDLGLLATYDRQLEGPAGRIHAARAAFVAELTPALLDLHRQIADGAEAPGITYRSQLNDRPYPELLQRTRDRDLVLRRTTAGPHRDELELFVDGEGLRHYASQGQLKTFALALRFAQARVLTRARERTPILLLDDLFDRLDADRVQGLLGLVRREGFAQVFISDTDEGRLRDLTFEDTHPPFFHRVVDGVVEALVGAPGT